MGMEVQKARDGGTESEEGDEGRKQQPTPKMGIGSSGDVLRKQRRRNTITKISAQEGAQTQRQQRNIG